MALATRPKPKVHHKKRQAQHHRHSKIYVKTYWPYLPMLAIMGAGTFIDRTWDAPRLALNQAGQASASGAPSALSHATSRLELVSGSNSAWLATVVAMIAVAALGVFMIRNSFRFQRVLVRGEHFVSKHPMLDIAAVAVFTTGFVLTG